jgi:small subunit ribosomal protein S6
MTKHYELLYLVPATYTDDELLPVKEKVKDLLKKFGGEITMEDSLGKKKLAYPIKKNFQGYYLLYEFDLEGSKLAELNKNLGMTNELLRHTIVTKNFKTPTIAQITEARAEKEESKAAEEKKEESKKDKIKLEDLDQRLDEILEGNIL